MIEHVAAGIDACSENEIRDGNLIGRQRHAAGPQQLITATHGQITRQRVGTRQAGFAQKGSLVRVAGCREGHDARVQEAILRGRVAVDAGLASCLDAQRATAWPPIS